MKHSQIYCQYQEPQVRALVWSLLSPGLVTESGLYPNCVTAHWCDGLYETLKPFLKQLDSDPLELQQWLQNYKSWRLGIRFEAYWAFILKHLQQQGKLQSYQSHLQIQAVINKPLKKTLASQTLASQTLGELDFVYQDNNAQLNHLEIAVKFYLLKPGEFGFERLIGPNGGDWYERKLEHLFKKQLTLSNAPEAQKKLAENFNLDINHISCQQQGLIKGMIFLPVTASTCFNDNETKLLNPDCLTGTWGTINNWYLSDPGEVGRWVMLKKLAWLEPQIYNTLDECLYSAKEMAYKLKTHFHNSVRSVLLARLEFDEQTKLWVEQQRVMVVDKYWPTFERTLDSIIQQSEQQPRDPG